MVQRTTLTLDDAVAEALKNQAREQGVPIKQLANAALKAGLLALKTGTGAKSYRLASRPLGKPSNGVNLDKALILADQLEDESLINKAQRR